MLMMKKLIEQEVAICQKNMCNTHLLLYYTTEMSKTFMCIFYVKVFAASQYWTSSCHFLKLCEKAPKMEAVADLLYELPKHYGLIFDIVHYVVCLQAERADLGPAFESLTRSNPLVSSPPHNTNLIWRYIILKESISSRRQAGHLPWWFASLEQF